MMDSERSTVGEFKGEGSRKKIAHAGAVSIEMVAFFSLAVKIGLSIYGILVMPVFLHTFPVTRVKFVTFALQAQLVMLGAPSYVPHSFPPSTYKDDTKMSSCGGDRRVLYWDLFTQRLVRIFEGHNEGTLLCIWDSRSHSIEPIQIFDTFKESVTSLCVRRTEIIAGSADGSLQKFDFRTNRQLSYNMGSPVKRMYMAINVDEFALASGLDSTLQLLAIETKRVKTIRKWVAVLQTLRHVVGGSEDGNIFIWNVSSSCAVENFPAHSSVVTSLNYHPKDNCMISASADGSVALWKAKS
nr:hypothetical protein [Tanacetum cinerariifolium]